MKIARMLHIFIYRIGYAFGYRVKTVEQAKKIYNLFGNNDSNSYCFDALGIWNSLSKQEICDAVSIEELCTAYQRSSTSNALKELTASEFIELRIDSHQISLVCDFYDQFKNRLSTQGKLSCFKKMVNCCNTYDDVKTVCLHHISSDQKSFSKILPWLYNAYGECYYLSYEDPCLSPTELIGKKLAQCNTTYEELREFFGCSVATRSIPEVLEKMIELSKSQKELEYVLRFCRKDSQEEKIVKEKLKNI